MHSRKWWRRRSGRDTAGRAACTPPETCGAVHGRCVFMKGLCGWKIYEVDAYGIYGTVIHVLIFEFRYKINALTYMNLFFKITRGKYFYWTLILLVCCSIAKLCPVLCNPMNCSTRDFPVLHYLSELVQIHTHWVGDVIQPFHIISTTGHHFIVATTAIPTNPNFSHLWEITAIE